MRVDEFINIMKKIISFKIRLEQEGITGQQAETILKVYLSDLTDRINVNMLKVV